MAEYCKVLADTIRMCNAQNNCDACQLYGESLCKYGRLITMGEVGNLEKIKTIETIVEQWAAEHPVKTNRMVLDEIFPNYNEENICMKNLTGQKPEKGCIFSICSECQNQWLNSEYKGANEK